MSWNKPRRVVIPWMETLSNMLAGVATPVLRRQPIWVSTDYSFDNRASDFDAVGLLITGPNGLAEWNYLRREIRARLLIDGRSMSWKKLNSDSLREAAFLPFLKAADQIRGLAIAIAFHRRPEFQIPKAELGRFMSSCRISANWKSRQLQHMFQIAYCTAMVVAGLSTEGQDVHWVSDQDPAFANQELEKDTVRMFGELLTIMSPHRLGEVRYGTTEYGVEPLFQEDLVAVPDLLCGAACEVLTSIRREYKEIPLIYAKLPTLAERAQQFLNWYGAEHWPLKRYICSFSTREGRPLSADILHPALFTRGGPLSLVVP